MGILGHYFDGLDPCSCNCLTVAGIVSDLQKNQALQLLPVAVCCCAIIRTSGTRYVSSHSARLRPGSGSSSWIGNKCHRTIPPQQPSVVVVYSIIPPAVQDLRVSGSPEAEIAMRCPVRQSILSAFPAGQKKSVPPQAPESGGPSTQPAALPSLTRRAPTTTCCLSRRASAKRRRCVACAKRPTPEQPTPTKRSNNTQALPSKCTLHPQCIWIYFDI